jgi:hypothetical protein
MNNATYRGGLPLIFKLDRGCFLTFDAIHGLALPSLRHEALRLLLETASVRHGKREPDIRVPGPTPVSAFISAGLIHL